MSVAEAVEHQKTKKGIRIDDFAKWDDVNNDYAKTFSEEISRCFGIDEDLKYFRKKSERDVLHFSNTERTRGYVFIGRLIFNADLETTQKAQIKKYCENGARVVKKLPICTDTGFMWEVK